MKKAFFILMAICAVLSFTGCVKTKILHCDHCGNEVEVNESSDMEEQWIIYCEKCNGELFGDDLLLGKNSAFCREN